MVESKNKPNLLLRWVLVLSVLGIAAVVIAGGLTLQKRIQQRKAEVYLEEGNSLLKEGRFAEAVSKFEAYLSRNPENIEAIAGYADLRVRVPEPNNGHLVKAIGAHQRILAIDARRSGSIRKLLDLYDQAGMSTEAIQQAGNILRVDASDGRARFVKAKQLAALRRFDEAMAELEIRHKQEPLDLEANRLRLAVMLEKGDRVDRMVGWSEKLIDRYPDEPYALIVKAYALSLGDTDDRLESEEVVDAIDLKPGSDQMLIEVLVELNDRLGRFENSMELVRDGVELHDYKDLRPTLVKRLWDAGQVDSLIELFEENQSWLHEDAGMYLPLLAWSYLQTSQQDRYVDLVQSRRGQTRSRYELIWYELFDVMSVDGLQEVENGFLEAERIIRKGLETFPADPYFHFWAGKADAAHGKYHNALVHWRQSVVGARGWMSPYMMIVDAQLKTNQAENAYELAAQLYSQRDQSASMAIVYLRAAQANIDKLTPVHFVFVAELVEAVQAQAEIPDLAGLQVEVLLRQNEREKAIAVVEDWLGQAELLDQQNMIRLARLSERYDLGLEADIVEASEETFGVTPQMVLYQSLGKSIDIGAEAALQYYDRNHELAAGEQMVWMIGRSRLVEKLSPDDALESWQSLLESNPEDLNVIKAVLQAESVWRELEQVSKVVELLAAVAGDDDYDVKLANARLLLMRADKLPKQQRDRVLVEAAVVLAALTRDYSYLLLPQLLMAQCQDRLGNAGMAAQYYGNAFKIAPDRILILTQQASGMVRAGESAAAYSLLRDLEPAFESDPNALLVLADWWRDIGEPDDFARCIERASSLMPENRGLNLQQISLLFQRGDQDEALTMLDNLLMAPDVDTVLMALRIFGETNQQTKIEEVLGLIDELPESVDSARRMWLRAEGLWRVGRRDEAHVLFEQAIGEHSVANVAGQSWLLLCLNAGDIDRLFSGMQAIAASGHAESGLAAIVAEQELIRSGLVGETRNLLSEAIRGVLSQIVVREIFDEITRVVNKTASWADILPSLAAASEQYDRSVALRGLYVTGLIRSGLMSQAAEVATEAIEDFPGQVSLMLLHLTAHAELRDWATVAKSGYALSGNGGDAGKIGAVNAAKAYLRMGDGLQSRGMLELVANRNDIESGKFVELAAMWVASGYTDGHAPDRYAGILDALFSEPFSRSMFLTIVTSAGTPHSEQAVVAWLDDCDNRSTDAPPADRMLFSGWARTAWDNLRHESLAVRCERYLKPLVNDSDQAESAALLLGQMYEVLGDLASASKYYQIVFDRNPNNLIAINNYSMVRSSMGDHDAAILLAKKARDLAPDTPFVLDTLALAALAGGDLNTAEVAIERAVELAPKSPEWRITACRIYLSLGKIGDAENQIKALKQLNLEGALTAENRKTIQLFEKSLREKKVAA